MERFGASLSVKQCRLFGIDPIDALRSANAEIGIQRFRLMSYWDEIEQQPGRYNFDTLDKMVDEITGFGGEISMCLGVRQPRWPESHWPEWAKTLPKKQRNKQLALYIAEVVQRYQNNPAIVSWQLENEALLRTFGEEGDFDRNRLKLEYYLVKQIDPERPIIMTTSTSWGIPIRSPIPDIVGFSNYAVVHNKGKYRKSLYYPWAFRLRALLIRLIHRKGTFIHELQAEPWGPKNIPEMSRSERNKSMSIDHLRRNLKMAAKTKLYPIDLWGLEWWYWERTQGHHGPWQAVHEILQAYSHSNQ